MVLQAWRTLDGKRRAFALGGTALVVIALGAALLAVPFRSPERSALKKSVGMDLMEQEAVPPPAAPRPGGVPTPQFQPTRMVRKGNLALEVVDMAAFEGRMRALAAQEGYLSAWTGTVEGSGQHRVQLTWRVPAERFEASLQAFKALGKVRREQVTTEDVGKAYADLEARRANKRVAAARIRELTQSRTGKLSDVLEAEQSLAQVTEELEAMDAQKRVMDNEIALSTLHAEIETPIPVAKGPEWRFWAPVAQAFHDSLDTLVHGASASLAFLVFLIPWLPLPAVGLWLWMRRRRKTEPEPLVFGP